MTHAVPPVSAPVSASDFARRPIPLRLVAFRGGLGVELYEAQRLGALHVEELTWSLPGVRFPVDLSGGVRSFNKRRGLLERAVLSVDLAELERWLSQNGDGAPSLGRLQRPVSVWPIDQGIGVGVCAEQASLGFNLLWAPDGEKAQFIIDNPRCVGGDMKLPLPFVLGFLSHVFGSLVRCEGRKLVVGGVAQIVVRELLPSLGFRLPQARGLNTSSLEFRSDCLTVTIDRTLPHWAASPVVAGAMEFAKTALAGDTALASGDLDSARRAYVTAIETAPRHRELSQIIASIDAQFEERAEAALGMLVESLPAVEFGLVGARLLARTGDIEGARLAVSKLAALERFAPLASGYWLALAEWLSDDEGKAEAIELAVAASNGFLPARWARFSARARLGDVHGAIADAEHLEAGCVGSKARHAVLVRAAGELADLGYVDAAGRLYERSMRYMPTDARSSLGVALSLIESGKPDRAMVLLHRTLELAQDDEGVQSAASLALARLLADYVGDLPQAINRARNVSGLSIEAIEARGLEAVWRSKIGDFAGASIAFSRLADAVHASTAIPPFRAAHWLLEGGNFFAQQSGDFRSAERLLAHALRLMPKDNDIAEAYRAAARRVHALQNRTLQESTPPDSELQEMRSRPASHGSRSSESSSAHEKLAANEQDLALALELQDEESERSLELEVESLKAQLLASRSPQPQALDALVDGLHRLGRDEEAYALLQAQVDDASGASKSALEQALRKVLQSLIAAARDAGESDDVELYELALNRLGA